MYIDIVKEITQHLHIALSKKHFDMLTHIKRETDASFTATIRRALEQYSTRTPIFVREEGEELETTRELDE